MIRTTLCALALLSPFLFPWPFTLALALAASVFFPPAAFLVGALMEALYSAGGFPVALLLGALASLAAYGVRAFVRARIVSP